MKIDLIRMILSHFPSDFFEQMIKKRDGKFLKKEDAVHAIIMEYAKVANGGESNFIFVDEKYLRVEK